MHSIVPFLAGILCFSPIAYASVDIISIVTKDQIQKEYSEFCKNNLNKGNTALDYCGELTKKSKDLRKNLEQILQRPAQASPSPQETDIKNLEEQISLLGTKLALIYAGKGGFDLIEAKTEDEKRAYEEQTNEIAQTAHISFATEIFLASQSGNNVYEKIKKAATTSLEETTTTKSEDALEQKFAKLNDINLTDWLKFLMGDVHTWWENGSVITGEPRADEKTHAYFYPCLNIGKISGEKNWFLEYTHNYIQILFPTDLRGMHTDYYWEKWQDKSTYINEIFRDPEFFRRYRLNLKLATLTMTQLYELHLEIDGANLELKYSPSATTAYWDLNPHNQLRLTRILLALKAAGMHQEAQLLYNILTKVLTTQKSEQKSDETVVSQREDDDALGYWKKANVGKILKKNDSTETMEEVGVQKVGYF